MPLAETFAMPNPPPTREKVRVEELARNAQAEADRTYRSDWYKYRNWVEEKRVEQVYHKRGCGPELYKALTILTHRKHQRSLKQRNYGSSRKPPDGYRIRKSNLRQGS